MYLGSFGLSFFFLAKTILVGFLYELFSQSSQLTLLFLFLLDAFRSGPPKIITVLIYRLLFGSTPASTLKP